MIVSNYASDSLLVLLGYGNGSFQRRSGYASGTEPLALASADLNGDEHADVVAPSFVGGTIFVYLGHGDRRTYR